MNCNLNLFLLAMSDSGNNVPPDGGRKRPRGPEDCLNWDDSDEEEFVSFTQAREFTPDVSKVYANKSVCEGKVDRLWKKGNEGNKGKKGAKSRVKSSKKKKSEAKCNTAGSIPEGNCFTCLLSCSSLVLVGLILHEMNSFWCLLLHVFSFVLCSLGSVDSTCQVDAQTSGQNDSGLGKSCLEESGFDGSTR